MNIVIPNTEAWIDKIFISFFFLLFFSSCNTAQHEVRFMVDMRSAGDFDDVGIRGSIKPLSWKKDLKLSDEDGDGIYEATVMLTDNKYYLRYKFVKDGSYELKGGDKRSLRVEEDVTIVERVYDVYHHLSKEELSKLRYTSEEINEDISTLARTIKYIHPNLYKYQEEAEFEASLDLMRSEALADPTLAGVYAAVSKFGAAIKCSHTFTNPWNQTSLTDQALFYQPDRLPFTFERVGKRAFVERNVSGNTAVKKSLEIVSINNIKMESIFTSLATFIAADGDNYEKKLDRLTLTGKEKFELFDIFYALTYGSHDSYDLVIFDHSLQDTIFTSVEAMSSSERTALLHKEYDDFETDLISTWKFELRENSTAYLKMGSFAVFNSDFNWKNFIDEAFDEIRENKVQHLILDIRDNEGGETSIVEYVLEYIVKQEIKVPDATSMLAYRTIPDDLKQHISTWEKLPYDWGNKVDQLAEDRFKLKSKKRDRNKVYKPKKNGFKGQVYLLTDVTNSSATHIMATYTKLYGLATIVGEATGGNQRGLNGGYLFFHKLPNTKVGIDIPVLGINIIPDTKDTYNGGIQPDITVKKTIKDVLSGSDTVVEKVMTLIAE